MVAPLEPAQLTVTLFPLIVVPGVATVPGLVLAGTTGMGVVPAGVWKYSGVLYAEQPVALHAFTFQRYCLPAVSVAVYDVPQVLVSTMAKPFTASRITIP